MKTPILSYTESTKPMKSHLRLNFSLIAPTGLVLSGLFFYFSVSLCEDRTFYSFIGVTLDRCLRYTVPYGTRHHRLSQGIECWSSFTPGVRMSCVFIWDGYRLTNLLLGLGVYSSVWPDVELTSKTLGYTSWVIWTRVSRVNTFTTFLSKENKVLWFKHH